MTLSVLCVRAELVHRPGEDGGAVDAIQLMATNEGQDAVLLRGAGIQFPPGLRYFLNGHVPFPRELLPGNSAVEVGRLFGTVARACPARSRRQGSIASPVRRRTP